MQSRLALNFMRIKITLFIVAAIVLLMTLAKPWHLQQEQLLKSSSQLSQLPNKTVPLIESVKHPVQKTDQASSAEVLKDFNQIELENSKLSYEEVSQKISQLSFELQKYKKYSYQDFNPQQMVNYLNLTRSHVVLMKKYILAKYKEVKL